MDSCVCPFCEDWLVQCRGMRFYTGCQACRALRAATTFRPRSCV